MTIAILQAEITNDPLSRGYSGMTDAQVSVSLNSENRSVVRTVTVDEVRQYLITQLNGTGNNQRSSLDLVREFAEAGTVRGVEPTVNPVASLNARRSACQMIWYMLNLEENDAKFPVDNTNVRNQFISIGPDGSNGPSVLTTAQLAAIDAMAAGTVSRARELGLPTISVGMDFEARAQAGG